MLKNTLKKSKGNQRQIVKKISEGLQKALDADGIAKFAPFSHNVLTPVTASVILGMLGLGVVGLKLRKFA